MLTLVWDVDDVLNDLMRCWLEQAWRREAPGCRVGYEDLVENPPHRLLGCTLDRYLDSLDRFRLGRGFADLQPRPEILAWFQRHGARFHHVALSSVPLAACHLSAEWTLRHLGRWLRTYRFVPSHRPHDPAPVLDLDKAACLRRMPQVSLFIDDNEDNVAAAREAGFETVLFPRPWNSARDRSVSDVIVQLDRLAAGRPEAPSSSRTTDDQAL